MHTLTLCRIRLQSRNFLTVAESRTTTYNRPLQYPRQTSVPTKFTSRIFVRGIHEKFISGNHLHFDTCLETFCRT